MSFSFVLTCYNFLSAKTVINSFISLCSVDLETHFTFGCRLVWISTYLIFFCSTFTCSVCLCRILMRNVVIWIPSNTILVGTKRVFKKDEEEEERIQHHSFSDPHHSLSIIHASSHTDWEERIQEKKSGEKEERKEEVHSKELTKIIFIFFVVLWNRLTSAFIGRFPLLSVFLWVVYHYVGLE